MCYSRAEGGQRCFGHAQTALSAAHAAVQKDPSDENYEKYRKAEIEYASTQKGAEKIMARMVEMGAQGDTNGVMDLTRVLERGNALRERNAAVRAAGRPTLTEAADREAALAAMTDQVPAAKSPGIEEFRSDLRARFENMRGSQAERKAQVALLAAPRALHRQALVAAAREAQVAHEANAPGARQIWGVPAGGKPDVAATDAYSVGRNIVRETLGRNDSASIDAALDRYANGQEFDPRVDAHHPEAARQAQCYARLERFLSPQQAANASEAYHCSRRLTAVMGGDQGNNRLRAEAAVNALAAAKTPEQVQEAAQKVSVLAAESKDQASARVTENTVKSLTGRTVRVETGLLARLRGTAGTVHLID